VSKAYQRNFSDPDGKLTVFDKGISGFQRGRKHIRKIFAASNFSAFVQDDGTLANVESEWSAIETRCLSIARQQPQDPVDDEFRLAVIDLICLHLVRSPAFDHIYNDARDSAVDDLMLEFESDPEARLFFSEDFGREPRIGELTALVEQLGQTQFANGQLRIELMLDNVGRLAHLMRSVHVQILECDSTRSGLVLADVPILLYETKSQRVGLQSGLSLDEADCIIAPITRFRAACLTRNPLPPMKLSTIEHVRCLNAMFMHGSMLEFACHPLDQAEVQATWGLRSSYSIDSWIRME
jgi:hypothetical protein